MIPAFDVEGGLPLALARFVSVAGQVAACGSLLYARFLRPPGLTPVTTKRLNRLGQFGLAAAIAGSLIWLLAQTRDMAGALTVADTWTVLSNTEFGHVLTVQITLLAIGLLLCTAGRQTTGAAAATAALLSQAGHSHALAMGGSYWLLASTTVHLIAAGLWLGALPGLYLVVAEESPAICLAAARRFSRAGIACVAALLATAIVQFSGLVMDIPGLIGTAYGWVICGKIVLFAALIAIAARNRLRLTPALNQHAGHAKAGLRRSIAAEITLGLLVLAAAGVLSELQPAMHTQKLWPLPWIPSLEAAREDTDIAQELLLASLALAACLAVFLAGLVLILRRRWRGQGAMMAVAAIAAAKLTSPHLSPLFVPAEPTLFYHSPTGFTVGAIVQGQSLYPANCAACHGPAGHGDGPLAKTLPIPPADLTAPHLWMHPDGQLFWWLTHGIEAPNGAPAMPGFATLPDDDRWSLIDYIRAHNAGLTLTQEGAWSQPVQAPDFGIACFSGDRKLSSLRGRPVRLILGPLPPDLPAAPGIETVVLARTPPAANVCSADDDAILQAYAVILGKPPANGTAVLIDASGWLRQAASNAAGLDASKSAKPMKMAMPMDMKM